MPNLPTGTVTFLFTDIEGSTGLATTLADGWADVLMQHRRVLREAFARRDGVEVDTQGDSFFVAFARASDAIAAAQEAQEALRAGPVRVRMGLHTGEATLREDNYVGVEVHRGARIAAAGHGGQVLLSQTTRDLVGSGFELVDLGPHRLKDLSEPQRLYQLGTESFPPLKTLSQTNLPVPATPFVGRERELADVGRLLRSSRLLTLTGPGGTGKTRLSLQAAAEARDEFPSGVWWVGLAALRDPALVLETIRESLNATGDLAGHIGDQEVLLILDNFEQVVAAAPGLASLLEQCGGLRVLVTSRETLRLASEQEYAVPPLVPDEAIQFFCARARAAKSTFEETDAVAEICRRLDNLPLALELAAARVKVLSSEQILARLEPMLPLLTGGPRDAPERQQTLEAAIRWSYDMLREDEQELFGDLSVFAGGWTLEAAETVCAADLDTLASLVDKSLVRQSGARFFMLETIREFALERLREEGKLADQTLRHASYFLQGAEANYGVLMENLTPPQLDWFQREHGNLRAALDRFHDSGVGPELEVRLVLASGKFRVHTGFFAEERQRTEDALARAGSVTPLLHARLLWLAGEAALIQGDVVRANDLAVESAGMLHELAPDSLDAAAAHSTLAISTYRLGGSARAAQLFDEATAIARRTGKDLPLAFALGNSANLALDERAFQRARPLLEECMAILRRLGQRMTLANVINDLGYIALADGDVDQAAAHFGESLSICREERTYYLIWAIEGLAVVAAYRDEPALAVTLFAATGRLMKDFGIGEGFYSLGDEFKERTLETARAALGDAAFEAAWAEGEAFSDEAAADAAAGVV